ncbi:MAG: 3-deoxy-8-phosphooctulonate synthase [Candidatus Cloacimonadota bacterium]|nr:3-deoxy-8-phosphooctulonate synthase [Candidatus Cloacimonadota bacterium]
MTYQELTENFFITAGPCVIEDEKTVMQIAEKIKELNDKLDAKFIFKASFKKANRTSIDSYIGPGITKGLKILDKVKLDFGLPILSDVHEVGEIAEAKEVLDIIQIPAFLSRQTDLIVEAAKSGKIVNIKKGQFMAPEDMQNVILKAEKFTNKILLTERGTSFGYHNLVVDFRGFQIMSGFGFPVIYDVTHSLQQPSTGKTSGGTPQFAPMMAKAAVATGFVNGLFIETHPNPKQALSDASTMLELSKLEKLVTDCLEIIE